MRDEIKEVFSFIDAADHSEHDDVANEYIRKGLQVTSVLTEEDPNDYMNYYLAGLCWYSSREDSELRDKGIEENFERVLALNENNPYAGFYLGYHNFNAGDYVKALRYFQHIPADYFIDEAQFARDVKVKELILCCTLLGVPEKLNKTVVENFFKGFMRFGNDPDLAVGEIEVVYEHCAEDESFAGDSELLDLIKVKLAEIEAFQASRH